MLRGKKILLIVAGGIAAFKSLELVRRLRGQGGLVRAILTEAGAEFVTPLSLQALSEDKVYRDLFSLTDESELGHIQLSRDADLLVVVPATANLLAKMRAGIADDLASTVLLATDKPMMVAPAMNLRMWLHQATIENMAVLRDRGAQAHEQVLGAHDGRDPGSDKIQNLAHGNDAAETVLRGVQHVPCGVERGEVRERLQPVEEDQPEQRLQHRLTAPEKITTAPNRLLPVDGLLV